MSTMAMSAQDSLWLTMDRPNNLMVVDGAVVLGGVPAIDAVQRAFAIAVDRFPVLRSRARDDGTGWSWVLDPEFHIGNHVKALTLDGPADMRALQEFVAAQRSQPLNRDRPLWIAHLVGPLQLPDGSVGSAIITRFHHAIADGVRLTQLLLGLCDPVGDATVPNVGRTPDAGHPAVPDLSGALGAMGSIAASVAGQAWSMASDPIGTVSSVPSALASVPGRAWATAVGVAESRPVNTATSVAKLFLTESEPTVWTGHPGMHKRVAWSAPLPLSVVKDVGRRFGATVNDVLVAVLAGALRRYLDERDGPIDEAVWLVPVNLKPFDISLPEELGNYFALVMLSMPIHVEEPIQRLADVRGRMLRIKNSDEAAVTFGLQRSMSFSPAAVQVFATNFFANKSVGVLTNVPGPTGPVTFADVPVVQVIGFAPCSGDQPMTATILSYDGGVTVGFATDAGLIPDPGRLVELVHKEFEVFANLS